MKTKPLTDMQVRRHMLTCMSSSIRNCGDIRFITSKINGFMLRHGSEFRTCEGQVVEVLKGMTREELTKSLLEIVRMSQEQQERFVRRY